MDSTSVISLGVSTRKFISNFYLMMMRPLWLASGIRGKTPNYNEQSY